MELYHDNCFDHIMSITDAARICQAQMRRHTFVDGLVLLNGTNDEGKPGTLTVNIHEANAGTYLIDYTDTFNPAMPTIHVTTRASYDCLVACLMNIVNSCVHRFITNKSAFARTKDPDAAPDGENPDTAGI